MIYITHGVVHNWKRERISHGLMLSASVFVLHMRQRTTKYVPLSEALEGKGDALTVDDASYAGLQAVLLARQYGHAVSWFVNGLNVERGLPYFPFQLSWMLDETQKSNCCFDGQHWQLTDENERRALRLRLKHSYLRMRSYEEISALVEMISSSVGVEPSTLEKSLCPVTSQELAVAVAAGVELQNHGWTHLNPQTFSARLLVADIRLNNAYLSCFQKAHLRIYAPPFGRQVAPLASSVARYVLLADRRFFSDPQNGSVVNRLDLDLTTSSKSVAPEWQHIE